MPKIQKSQHFILYQAWSSQDTFVLRVLRRLVLRRQRRFFTTTVVPSAALFLTLTVFGRRRRRVFRVVFFFPRVVVRRFLRFTPAVFGAFRFVALDTPAPAAELTTGDEDAPTSASSCNSHHDDGSLLHFRTILYGYHGTSTSSTIHSSEVCKSLEEIYITFRLSWGCALDRNFPAVGRNCSVCTSLSLAGNKVHTTAAVTERESKENENFKYGRRSLDL